MLELGWYAFIRASASVFCIINNTGLSTKLLSGRINITGKKPFLELVINIRELEAICNPVSLSNITKTLLIYLKTTRVFIHKRNMACQHSIGSIPLPFESLWKFCFLQLRFSYLVKFLSTAQHCGYPGLLNPGLPRDIGSSQLQGNFILVGNDIAALRAGTELPGK